MATTAVNLSVPAPVDDSMEMSSPGRHNLDEDIDFDDDWEPTPNDTGANDDDHMMDDGEQTRPATATDDVMEDDLQLGEQTVVQEEFMQDSPTQEQQLEDEDLIDYSDDELPDEVVEDAAAPVIEEQAMATAVVPDVYEETVEETTVQPSGESVSAHPLEDATDIAAVVEEATAPLSTAVVTELLDDGATAESFDAEGTDSLEHTVIQPPTADIEQHAEEQTDAGLDAPQITDDAESQRPAISLDTSAQTPADGPATPTDTGLHAMSVRFDDYQFPLFKSRHQPDGLLKNDNLASLSLGELIQNCRQRLAIKTGETVPEDQDLVLGFEQLGLILVEDSRAAFECSLDEVLDIYLQLHRNDEVEDIPPFSMNLSLQLKFTSSISVLKQAAAGGSGMSSFGVNHTGEEQQVGEYDEYGEGEHGEAGYEHFEEQYDLNGTSDGQEYEQAQDEGSIPTQQEEDTNDYHGEYEGQQFEHPGQDHYHEDEQYQEDFGEGQYYEEEQDEVSQLLDDHALEGDGQLEESADAVYHATNEQTALQDESGQAFFEAAGEEEKAASTATSATFHGDDEQDTTDRGQLESTTLQAGNETEAVVQGEQQQDQPELDLEQTGGDTQHSEHHDLANAESNAQETGAEDYIGEFEEQQYEEGHLKQNEDHDAFGELDDVYGEDGNQADASAAQQGDFDHTDRHLDEEDDPFQTAHDLFDGEDEQDTEEQIKLDNAADDATLVASATNGEQHGDTEDFIDFDADEETTVDDAKVKQSNTTATAGGSRTPLAKRSYEDLAGDDEIDFGTPEPKKAKVS